MPSLPQTPRTLYDKVFKSHIVNQQPDGTILLYIDRHLVHEVTSPQAFEGLTKAKRRVRRPDCTLATVDHNIPTTPRTNFRDAKSFVEEPDSRVQVTTLEDNVRDFGLTYFGMGDARQGIVHIIGPEQGFTLPGTTVVCGDSHTSTHGAFGALAFGIGTSEVEHVLATQTLITKRSKNMRITVDGDLLPGVSSKDVILHIIGIIGTAGGNGAVIEYAGSAIRGLSMEARMSICNMSIEAGARAGMIAPDETTFSYLRGRPLAPKYGSDEWNHAVEYWQSLRADPGAKYDREVSITAEDIIPTVSWGTSPQDVIPITGVVPDPSSFNMPSRQQAAAQALKYMGLTPGTPMKEIMLDKVFIGSCTNARIEDLRAAASVVGGNHVAKNLKRAMIVPGSGLVKKQAEAEGLDQIFIDAGFEWREAGCSMCLGMNPDILSPQERCASTSNRNFEGRQGAGGRTHLMSPVMAAVAALAGKLADIRDYMPSERANGASGKKAKSGVDPQPHVADINDESDAERLLDQPADDEPHVNEHAPAASAEGNLPAQSAGLPKFIVLTGIAAPLQRTNVDTDAIIPKQFLKTIKRTGLGTALFHGLRYIPGTEKPDLEFVLNQEPYTSAKILVNQGENFGCGSSREHAPWALLDFGIKVVIAESFADIFFNNMFKNGMLPIAIPDTRILEKLTKIAKEERELSVDLPNQTIKDDKGDIITAFDIEEFRKHCLVEGLDDIGLTMAMEDQIRDFEEQRSIDTPWLDGSSFMARDGMGRAKMVKAVSVPKTNRGEEKTEPLEW